MNPTVAHTIIEYPSVSSIQVTRMKTFRHYKSNQIGSKDKATNTLENLQIPTENVEQKNRSFGEALTKKAGHGMTFTQLFFRVCGIHTHVNYSDHIFKVKNFFQF